jgi:hypothetical protein
MVGGSLMLNSIRSMMGGQRHGFGDTSMTNESAARQAATPSVDQSNSPMAHDLGGDDIGRAGDHADDGSHAGLYDEDMNDQAMNDDHQDDMDLDSDDYGGDDGGDDGSSYA